MRPARDKFKIKSEANAAAWLPGVARGDCGKILKAYNARVNPLLAGMLDKMGKAGTAGMAGSGKRREKLIMRESINVF